MRILHIDLGRELRGGQLQVLLLVKTLQRAKHECLLLARPESPLFQRASITKGWEVRPATPMALLSLSKQFDLVHAHDAQAHTWAATASRKPFVVSRRVAFAIGKSMLSKLKYGRAARYLAVSKFVSKRVAAAGVPLAKIDIVHDAVETEEQIQEWNREGPVVALASRDPQKGRDLIERASEIAGVPVVFSEDLAADLANASAFVYITRSEGFGSAALLAMSKGVPLIASGVDGLAEVFENNVSGISVANHANSVAAALQRLRVNPDLARTLIANAHSRALNLFNTTALLNNTVASYRRALVAG